jgi:hypothetical protein
VGKSLKRWLWRKRLSDDGPWQDASICFVRPIVRRPFRKTDHHLHQLVHKLQLSFRNWGSSCRIEHSLDHAAFGPVLSADWRIVVRVLVSTALLCEACQVGHR